MKIFGFIKSRNRGFWLLLSLLVAGFLGWKVVVPPNDYPTSKEFIDPCNGKPSPEFAAYVLPRVSEDGYTVSVDMGSVPGDVIKSAVLQYLSPVIRMHPEARHVNVTWSVLYPHYNMAFTLDYDRQGGIVTEEQSDLNNSSNPKNTTVLGRDITDRHIHEGVCGFKDYDVWAREHWRK